MVVSTPSPPFRNILQKEIKMDQNQKSPQPFPNILVKMDQKNLPSKTTTFLQAIQTNKNLMLNPPRRCEATPRVYLAGLLGLERAWGAIGRPIGDEVFKIEEWWKQKHDLSFFLAEIFEKSYRFWRGHSPNTQGGTNCKIGLEEKTLSG